MGAMSGQALGQGKELLKQRELRLSYGTQVALPDNSIVFPSPQARQEKLLRNAPAELGLIARNIKNKYDNYQHLDRGFCGSMAVQLPVCGCWIRSSSSVS